MENRIKKMGEICFWIGLLVELIIVIIDKSAYTNPYESYLFRITFLLFGVKLITTKFTKRQWICVVCFGMVALCSYLINERDEAVRAVVFIASCKDIELKKIIKLTFITTLSGCVLLILLSVTGIYGKVAVVADYGRDGIETRYTLGMGHPNAFHCMMWMVMTLAIYCYASEMKWYHYILTVIGNIFVYVLSDSNTSMLLATVMILAIMVLRYSNYLRNASWVYWSAAVIVIGCIAFSIYGAYVGNGYGDSNSFMYKLDKVLNGRYEYCYKVEAARLVNWKLFAAPQNQEYFDAGFVRAFYWYGIIPGALYCIMHLYLIWSSYRNKDYVLMVMIVAFSIYNLMEAHFVSVYLLRNYLLIYMGSYWYQTELLQCGMQQSSEGYFWQLRKLVGRHSI